MFLIRAREPCIYAVHKKGKKMLPTFLRSRMKVKRLRALQNDHGEWNLADGETSRVVHSPPLMLALP
jgi:hypothetical protein